jgi:hypothetical protein
MQHQPSGILEGLTDAERRQLSAFQGAVQQHDRARLKAIAAALDACLPNEQHRNCRRFLLHCISNMPREQCLPMIQIASTQNAHCIVEILELYGRYNMAANRTPLVFQAIMAQSSDDFNFLLETLATWLQEPKDDVLTCWEQLEPMLPVPELISLLRSECTTSSSGKHTWQCVLCALKRQTSAEFRMKDSLIGNGIVTKSSVKSSKTKPQKPQSPRRQQQQQQQQQHEQQVPAKPEREPQSEMLWSSSAEPLFELEPARRCSYNDDEQQRTAAAVAVVPPATLLYSGKQFDLRRLCSACAGEARSFVTALGHNFDVHQAVDHCKRSLRERRRDVDRLKAGWLAYEQQQRAVGRLMQAVCTAQHSAASRDTLASRTAARTAAAAAVAQHTAAVRAAFQSSAAAAAATAAGTALDSKLLAVTQKTVTAGVTAADLLAQLTLERSLGVSGSGGSHVSSERRCATSALPADFASNGMPVTATGASLALKMPGAVTVLKRALVTEQQQLHGCKATASDKAGLVRVRELVRAQQRALAAAAAAAQQRSAWVQQSLSLDEHKAMLGSLTVLERLVCCYIVLCNCLFMYRARAPYTAVTE